MLQRLASRLRGAPPWSIAGLLALGALLLYAPVARHRFLLYDDPQYVLENPMVRAGLSWKGAAWAFSTLHFSNWHPLTWLSHMLDVELFGLDPGAHHLVSAALHALNAALLFLVLAGMTRAVGRSAFAAALFAAHPLHVESVAWVAERKDVLSTLLGLGALWAWRRYAERPGPGRYAPVLAAFAASLMAKPMWVTLPFFLLLLDVWPLQRIERPRLAADPGPPSLPGRPPAALLLEKLPLLALSAASSVVTVAAQARGGAVSGLEVGLGARAANALVSCARYLFLAVWPVDLAAFYPFPASLPAWQIAGAALLLAAASAAAIACLGRAPWLAVGWFWFLGTLVPVIGLVQVGGQAMADRYTYLPLVGIFVSVGWGGHRILGTRAAPLAAGAVLVGLCALTWRQVALWRDQVTLFGHAIAVTGENPRARGLLAMGLLRSGRLAEARAEAFEAVRLEPASARHRLTLAMVDAELGRLGEARASLRAAVELSPRLAPAWVLLGRVEAAAGNLAEARRIAARLEPLDPAAAAELRGQLGPR